MSTAESIASALSAPQNLRTENAAAGMGIDQSARELDGSLSAITVSDSSAQTARSGAPNAPMPGFLAAEPTAAFAGTVAAVSLPATLPSSSAFASLITLLNAQSAVATPTTSTNMSYANQLVSAMGAFAPADGIGQLYGAKEPGTLAVMLADPSAANRS